MKLIHLSDLHLGKRLNELSLIEDQRDILDKILTVTAQEAPEAVIIAGDIYDRANPPVEAVRLFDDFLVRLTALGTKVLMISGNHDAAERVAYGGRIFAQGGVYVSPVYEGHVSPVTLSDAYGEVRFYLLPYLHPEAVKPFFPERDITSFQAAAEAAVSEMQVDPAMRNVLVAHQFVTGGQTSESERRSIGTLDNVDAEVFADFDYVALGHLHRPQRVGREDGTIRYCGTPLKYSLSEHLGDKSVTVAELGPKGSISLRTVPLTPLREIRPLRGGFDELMLRGPLAGQEQDYYYVTLTDEIEIPNAAARLRERYRNVMSLEYERTRQSMEAPIPEAVAERTPMALLQELYTIQHGGREMDEETAALAAEMMQKIAGWQA